MVRTAERVEPRPPSRPQRDLAGRIIHVIGIVGRVFVALGLVLLFFTAYLLWGTGVYTAQEQERATHELANNPLVDQELLAEGNIPPARPAEPVGLGEPLFTISIPKIALESAVVEGVGRSELTKGPGHFPSCEQTGGDRDCIDEASYPGEAGNVAISGHRTTYGAPFYKLDELEEGDIIDYISGRARYRYRVREQKIVDPVAGFGVVEQHGRAETTLTTCHPRFSAAQRLIIFADYEGSSIINDAGPGAVVATDGPAPSGQVVAPDVIILAIIALASGLGSLAISPSTRRFAAWSAVVVAGSAALWVGLFPRILVLMPANY